MIWRSETELAMDFMEYTQQFCEVFDHPDQGQSSSQQLLRLCQGRASVAEYSISFCILTVDSEWNEPALLVSFHNGHNVEIQLELACRDE